jgi:hypothetical protein
MYDVGRGGSLEWPTKSPDLTSMNLFFGRFVKEISKTLFVDETRKDEEYDF